MWAELTTAVAGLFAGLLDERNPPELAEQEFERLGQLSDFTTLARSAVERDAYPHE